MQGHPILPLPPAALSGVIETVIIGDSMTVGCSGSGPLITGAARANGVITCDAASHGLGSGCLVTTFNITPADFNAREVPVSRIDPDHFTYASTGADGSAADISASKQMSCVNLRRQGDNGYFFWLNSASKGAFRLTHNAGANGQTSVDMLARFTADVLAYPAAQLIIIFTGYNDFVGASLSAAQVYANVRAMALAVGALKNVIIVSAIPWTTGGTATNRGEAVLYNRTIREFCDATNNCRYADAAHYLVDAMHATRFSPLSNMLLADGIHPSPRGAERIGQAIWEAISNWVSSPSRLVSCNADNRGYDVNNKNLQNDAPWVATGGYLAGGATGVTPQGFAVTNGGSAATVVSANARADGLGYDVQAVFTPGALNDTVVISSPGYTVAAGFSPGDKIRVMCEIGMAGVVGAKIKSIAFSLTAETANGYPGDVIFPGATNESFFPQTDLLLTVVSPEFVILAGVTSFGYSITVTAGGAGTALTLKVGRLSIEKV